MKFYVLIKLHQRFFRFSHVNIAQRNLGSEILEDVILSTDTCEITLND